jgi:predicted transcriptional regulator
MNKGTEAKKGADPEPSHPGTSSSWTFLTNHSHVLICLAQDPTSRLRDVAERVGITERAVQKIVTDLEEAGVLTRIRDGRRNRYEVHPGVPLRHPVEKHRRVSDLLTMVSDRDV